MSDFYDSNDNDFVPRTSSGQFVGQNPSADTNNQTFFGNYSAPLTNSTGSSRVTSAYGSGPDPAYGFGAGPAALPLGNFTEEKYQQIYDEPDIHPTGELQSSFNASGEPVQSDVKKPGCWEPEYYSHYFNVETSDVLKRVFYTIRPWPPSFFDLIADNPDLYGPFWITTSVVFFMAVTGGFARYLKVVINDKESMDYSFERAAIGAAVIYGFNFILPLALWITLRCIEVRLNLLDLICLYGYASFIYIPVSILCVIPSLVPGDPSWLRWVLIMSGCVVSTWFMLSNLFGPLKVVPKTGWIILLVIGLLDAGLALLLVFYFFVYNLGQ